MRSEEFAMNDFSGIYSSRRVKAVADKKAAKGTRVYAMRALVSSHRGGRGILFIRALAAGGEGERPRLHRRAHRVRVRRGRRADGCGHRRSRAHRQREEGSRQIILRGADIQ